MGCCGNSYVPIPGTQYSGGENNLAYSPPPSNPQWKVTYPNGVTLEFDHEWQAEQARAISGGIKEKIDPGEPQPGEPENGRDPVQSA